MRGEVDAAVSAAAGGQGQINAGDVAILSVLADAPEPENPDVPTVDEFDLEVPMGTSFYVVSQEGLDDQLRDDMITSLERSEERRVGKERTVRWWREVVRDSETSSLVGRS